MNKIYRVVWNASLGAWVVVSELAKSCKKTKSTVDNCQNLNEKVPSLKRMHFFQLSLLAMCIGVGHQTYAAKNVTTTGTGNGIQLGTNANATDLGATTFYWENPNIPEADRVNKTSTGGVAIGSNAKASSSGSIVVGHDSVATGTEGQLASTIIGSQSYSNGNNNVVIGNRSLALKHGSMAIGRESVATENSALAIGVVASATGVKSVAVGQSSVASGNRAIAIGSSNDPESTTKWSELHTEASGIDSLALGTVANASGDNAISIGTNAEANKTGSTAVGFESNAAGVNSMAFGTSAKANNIGSTAVGFKSNAAGVESIAFGANSKANLDYAIAIGSSTQAFAESIALGQEAEATAKGSVSIGNKAKVSNQFSVGVGPSVESTGLNSVAIGYQSKALDSAATAVGTNAVASKLSGTAIGTSSKANGIVSLAIGSNSIAQEYGAIAGGFNSEAKGVNSIALGPYAKSSKDNSVALGASSNTEMDATSEVLAEFDNLEFGKFEGQAADAGMQVSVGAKGAERQIKNVAAGKISAVSTDAINGSQLFATNHVLDKLASSTKTIIGGNIQLDNSGNITGPFVVNGSNYDTIADAIEAARPDIEKGTNIVSVNKTTNAEGKDKYIIDAKGVTASAGSDAVTVTPKNAGSNITEYAIDLNKETKESLVKADSALQTIVTQINGDNVKTLDKNDNTANFLTGKNIKLIANDKGIEIGTADAVEFDNVTVGNSIIKGDSISTSNLTVAGETKLGDKFIVNNDGATYNGPITKDEHIVNKNYVDNQAVKAKTEVKQGKNIIVNPTVGDDGQTIYTVTTANEVDFTKVTVGDTTITSEGLVVAGGPSLTKDGISAGDKQIQNVADGKIADDSTDAINGSQLYNLGNNVINIFGGDAEYVNNQMTWTNIGNTGENTIDDAIKYVNAQVTNANKGWKLRTDSGVAATSTVKPDDVVNIKGDASQGVLVTNSGNDIKVGLSDSIVVGSGDNAVSLDGNTGTIKVGDVVIDGSNGNITAGQVTVNGDVGTVNGLTNTIWNPDNIVSGQAATEDQLKQVAQTAAAAATAAKTTVTKGNNITVTESKNSDGSTNYQVSTNKNVEFENVTSGSISANNVTVGHVVIDQAGINAGDQKVSNVSDGTISSTSKDAINGSQLFVSNSNIYKYLGGDANYETNTGPTYNVGGGSHTNVGSALEALDNRDNQLDSKINNLGDQLQQAFYSTNKRVDDVEKRAMAGIAASMAMETAPYVAGKWTYAAAAAHHGGENAVGVTLRKTADNGRWSLTSGFATASQGDPSIRIGISGVID